MAKKIEKRGRKTLLTPEKIKIISQLLKKGMSNRDCCNFLNVSEVSFYSWINHAKEIEEKVNSNKYSPNKKEKLLLNFLYTLKKSQVEFKEFHLDKIANAKEWQSSSWLLANKFPNEFSLNRHTENGGVKNQTINIISSEKLDGIFKLIQDRKRIGQDESGGIGTGGETNQDADSNIKVP